MTDTPIKKGTRFFAQWADSNAEWEVLSARGSVCHCIIVSGDGQGVVRSFAKDEIQRILEWAATVQKDFAESAAFFAGLQVGQIVHYNNGFNTFIRCKVVMHENRNQLQKIALVGDWKSSDLRTEDYHVAEVRSGCIWTPHATTVFECAKYAWKYRSIDPTQLDPIKLA